MKRQFRAVGQAAIATLLLMGASPIARAQATDPVAHARALARDRDFDSARRELRDVLARQPGNSDAIEALAYVELWSGHPSRANRLTAEWLASHPNDVELLVASARSLRQLNRKPEALTAVERAGALAPTRADIVSLRDLLRHDVHGAEATVAFDYDSWADHRDPLRESHAAIRQNTDAGAAIARVSHAARFGLRDDKYELEAYPTLGGGYATLGASYSPTATLYPRSSVTTELSASFPLRLEGSLGYRRLNFANAVNVFTGSVGAYERDFLFDVRVNHVDGGSSGNSFMLSARRFFTDERQSVSVQFATGSIREDIRTTADIGALSSRSIGAEGAFVLWSHVILTLRGGIGRDDVASTGPVRRVWGGLGTGGRF
ncbi:MAG: YaiO family outer membrane beta-barrel protein [bacterium]